MTAKPRTPAGLKTAGKRLWTAIIGRFEMADHELVMLEEACRIRDRLVDLREQVTRDGVMIPSSQGDRVHPAVGEGRQQQLALARILVTLGVPALDEDRLPTSRRIRGVYGAAGADE